MQALRRGHQFEYRDERGVDRTGSADVWTGEGGRRAVLVLRGLRQADLMAQARQALLTLTHTWLPYLLPADVRLLVLALRPRQGGGTKARALVLPLGA